MTLLSSNLYVYAACGFLTILLAATPAEVVADVLPAQHRSVAFRELDADGDGWISRTEAAAHPVVATNFDQVDRDRDGRLSREEFETIPLNRSDQPGRFRALDLG